MTSARSRPASVKRMRAASSNGEPSFHEQLELRYILDHVGAEGGTIVAARQTGCLEQCA